MASNPIISRHVKPCEQTQSNELLPESEWREFLNPHFSPVVCCSAGYIRHYCVALGRTPQRTVKYACGTLPARALSWRRLRRFATTTGEKGGLTDKPHDRSGSAIMSRLEFFGPHDAMNRALIFGRG